MNCNRSCSAVTLNLDKSRDKSESGIDAEDVISSNLILSAHHLWTHYDVMKQRIRSSKSQTFQGFCSLSLIKAECL